MSKIPNKFSKINYSLKDSIQNELELTKEEVKNKSNRIINIKMKLINDTSVSDNAKNRILLLIDTLLNRLEQITERVNVEQYKMSTLDEDSKIADKVDIELIRKLLKTTSDQIEKVQNVLPSTKS